MSAYNVTILAEDMATLYWLADRGYDGNFLALATLVADPEDDPEEGGYVFALTEPEAWEFSEHIESDPDAFLSCCDSETLVRALIDFWQEIV